MAQTLKHDAEHYAFLLRCERRTHRIVEMHFANFVDKQRVEIEHLQKQLNQLLEEKSAAYVIGLLSQRTGEKE